MASTTGNLTALFFNESTISSPPLASIYITDDEGHEYDFFAQGKLARRIFRDNIATGTSVTLTHEGHKISELKENKNA